MAKSSNKITIHFGMSGTPAWMLLDKNYMTARDKTLEAMHKIVRTELIRTITNRYNVTAEQMENVITATMDKRTGMWSVKGRSIGRLGLAAFNARRQAEGAYYEFMRGKGKVLPHSFIAKMPSGHQGIFLRKNKNRLPIKQEFRLSYAEMMRPLSIRDDMNKFIDATIFPLLEKNLAEANSGR